MLFKKKDSSIRHYEEPYEQNGLYHPLFASLLAFSVQKRVQSIQLISLQMYNVETELFIHTTSLETQMVREWEQNTLNSRLNDKEGQLSGGRKKGERTVFAIW